MERGLDFEARSTALRAGLSAERQENFSLHTRHLRSLRCARSCCVPGYFHSRLTALTYRIKSSLTQAHGQNGVMAGRPL